MHASTFARSIAPGLSFAVWLTGCGGQDAPPAKEVVRPVKTFVFGEPERTRSFNYPGQVYANVVAGFSVLLLASFKPVIYFGGLTAVTMINTTLGALFILPLLLAAVRPVFKAR